MPARRKYWPPPPPPPDGELALRTYDESAWARADEYRGRHKHPDELCGPGNREGSWAALGALNGVLVVCGRCGTLGAWPRVLRAAYAAKRLDIAPHDGCAAATCSRARSHKLPRHAAQQRRWAAQLRDGSRTLVERPMHVEQPAARPIDGASLDAIIDDALARLPPA